MTRIYLSHSEGEAAAARALRRALGGSLVLVTRDDLGRDPPWSRVQLAIEGADAFAMLVGADAAHDNWAGMELRHALAVQRLRGAASFPVLPLTLGQARLGAAEHFFDSEPAYLDIGGGDDGMSAAAGALRTALTQRV